jgi:HEAT repeat protein
MAAWALGELEARDVVSALTTAVKNDDDSSVRETSAWALGQMEVKSTADLLATVAASDKSSRVRATAAWAVGQLNPGRAPAPLLTALRDSDDDVRLNAAWALSQISDPDDVQGVTAALRVEKSDRVRQALVRALLESGDRSSDVFKDLLESKDRETREMAVRALAGRRGPWPWPRPQPRPRPNP